MSTSAISSRSSLYAYLTSVQGTGKTGGTEKHADDPSSSGKSQSADSSTPATGDLALQLSQAIRDALDNLADDADSDDVLQSVDDAVKATLQDNGIDLSPLAKGPGGPRGPGGPGGPRGPGGPPPGPPPGKTEETEETEETESSSTTSTTSTDSLDEVLKKLGLDPEEFKSNLLSQVSTAQASGSAVDYSKIFEGISAGQSLNVLA